MEKSIADYEKDINLALRHAGKQNRSLKLQVKALASALRTLDLANRQIETLEDVTVLEQTRYGSKLAPHPVFKVQRDAQDSVTRQMKALGLTAADLTVGDDDDPLVDLTKKLNKVKKS